MKSRLRKKILKGRKPKRIHLNLYSKGYWIQEHVGTITEYFETGFEGMEWFFIKDGKGDWDWGNIVTFEDGDELVIFNADNSIAYQGLIWKEIPSPQPQVLGMWYHWHPKGVDPEQWARWCLETPKKKAVLARIMVGHKSSQKDARDKSFEEMMASPDGLALKELLSKKAGV